MAAAAGALVILTFFPHARTSTIPNLAVVRFDAADDPPALRNLADELTDDVTVRMAAASGGHYRVIGNAAILRTPREQRDLRAIASTLRCSYAVLGQVEATGKRILILAHLIRLSDLTHIRVVRFERQTDDPASLESQVTAEIASQFAAQMSNQPDRAGSFRAGSR